LAANRRSLAITKAYGRRLRAIEQRVLAQNRRAWRLSGDFDADYAEWFAVMAPTVAAAQTLGIRVTAGYLGAFRSSETETVVNPPRLDSTDLIGRTRDGRTFEEGWTSPLIKTKVAMGEGKSIPEASKIGFEASGNLIRLDTYAAFREAMSRHMQQNELIIGYKRVEGDEPTCGGCLAAIDNEVLSPEEDFATHPGCDCTAEAVYADVNDEFEHPTGAERFSRMTEQEKLEAVGLDAAQLIDDGQIQLAELKGVSVTALGDNFLTERPVSDLT
jgi:hypothetical protein